MQASQQRHQGRRRQRDVRLNTVRGSDWGADQQVVERSSIPPKAVNWRMGFAWSRVTRGDARSLSRAKVTITERDEAHGLIAQRAFGGTNKWRTCYVSDGTGHAMLTTMSDQAIAQIPVHERAKAIADPRLPRYGAIVRNLVTGELVNVARLPRLLAAARTSYRVTTNGDLRHSHHRQRPGVASLGNMEAVQFHPTAFRPVSSSPRCPGATAICRRTSTAIASCPTMSRRKRACVHDAVSRRMEEHIAKAKASIRFGTTRG
jgi:fumarate reductase flavoprotein subunit